MDWLLLQPYSESNACALLRLISAVKPPVQAKVQRYLTTRMATATNPVGNNVCVLHARA